jgi:hypothetical protein
MEAITDNEKAQSWKKQMNSVALPKTLVDQEMQPNTLSETSKVIQFS